MLVNRRGLRILHETPLAMSVSILGLIYILEIFNPLQGGLTVGLTGALFVLVPVTWFYFGRASTQVHRDSFSCDRPVGVVTSLTVSINSHLVFQPSSSTGSTIRSSTTRSRWASRTRSGNLQQRRRVGRYIEWRDHCFWIWGVCRELLSSRRLVRLWSDTDLDVVAHGSADSDVWNDPWRAGFTFDGSAHVARGCGSRATSDGAGASGRFAGKGANQ